MFSTLTGNEIVEPGRPCGRGLTEDAARDMRLEIGTPVATSLIDAHAGGLGMIGVGLSDRPADFKNRLGKQTVKCIDIIVTFMAFKRRGLPGSSEVLIATFLYYSEISV